jgi:hypothetical protein
MYRPETEIEKEMVCECTATFFIVHISVNTPLKTPDLRCIHSCSYTNIGYLSNGPSRVGVSPTRLRTETGLFSETIFRILVNGKRPKSR